LKRRKVIAVVLQVIAVIIVAGSAWVLHYNNYQSGEKAYNKANYEDSAKFQEQFFTMAEAVIDKIHLGSLFETNGELDLSKPIAKIDRGEFDGVKTYSVEDFIRFGKQIGLYLDNNNEVQGEGNELSEGDSGEGLLLWKLPELDYNIEEDFYYIDYDEGAEAAVVSMGSLTYYVLEGLGNYYKALDIVSVETNFIYRLAYGNDTGEQYVYTNAPERSLEEIKKLSGKYIYNDIHAIKLDSNLEVDWEPINEWIVQNNFYDSSAYSLIMIVDTSYPIKTDSFYQSHIAYEHGRQIFIAGNLCLGVGLVLMCLTCLYLIYVSGYHSEDGEIVLTRLDQWYTEPALFLWIAIIYLVQKGIGLFFNYFYIPAIYQQQQYTVELVKLIAIYAIGFVALLSFVRRIKAGIFWRDSILRRAILRLNEYLDRGNHLVKLVLMFLLFLMVNAAIVLALDQYMTISIIAAVVFNGYSLHLLLQRENDRFILKEGIYKIAAGETEYQFEENLLHHQEKELAMHLNSINEGLKNSVDEQTKSERLKADLITNVSHDIKTPLTSIINYIDLLKREPIEDEKVLEYIEVLNQKAFRLKTLTDDLVEASKASSGNINLELMDIDLVELVNQTNGEFEEKFCENQLQMVIAMPEEPLMIRADGRRMWRVLENLYGNVVKYGMKDTRVYIEVAAKGNNVVFSIKNVSKYELNIHAEELTERFVRGDVSRNTEGSGLGLSIAKNLTQLQGGVFELYIDGDLFKATVIMPRTEEIQGY